MFDWLNHKPKMPNPTREEMLNSQKPPEEPKKNGVVITPQEPVPAKYQFYRYGLLLGTFRHSTQLKQWAFEVEQRRPTYIAGHWEVEPMTAEEHFQIAAQLRVLNEQPTNEGGIACK